MNLDTIVSQLKDERDKLDRAISALNGMSGKKYGKRTLSPEARERIAAAQRARWAKTKRKKP